MIWNDSLYTDNYVGMVRFAYARLKDYGRAEDAVQRTFQKLIDNMSTIETTEGVRRWLYTALRRYIIDLVRTNVVAERALRAAHPGAKFNIEGEYTPTDSETPESLATSNETAVEVHATLALLKPIVRDTLVRYYLQSQTIPEIMVATGQTNPAVKSALHRGRAVFQAHIKGTVRQPKPVRVKQPKPVYTHGMPAYYTRMKCRCHPCRMAYNLYNKHKTLDWLGVWVDAAA